MPLIPDMIFPMPPTIPIPCPYMTVPVPKPTSIMLTIHSSFLLNQPLKLFHQFLVLISPLVNSLTLSRISICVKILPFVIKT